MPTKAIAIRVTIGVGPPPRTNATFAWPPQVSRTEVHSLEGLPSRIGVYQASTRLGSREISVFVYFGRSKPTPRQLHAANTELRRSSLG
jgi:hypothetical protein